MHAAPGGRAELALSCRRGIPGRSTRLVESLHGDGERHASNRRERPPFPSRPARDGAAFPFRCELSLAPSITFWTQLSAYHEFGRGPIPGLVREKAREAPELAGVIDDLSVIGKHQTFVDLMMTALFPPAFGSKSTGRPCSPSSCVDATPPFRRSLMNEDGTLQGQGELPAEAQRGPHDGGRTALARLRAGPRAGVRPRARRRRPGADVHHDRFRHRAGSASSGCSSTGGSSTCRSSGPSRRSPMG